jgi:hypothetical protein
MEPFPRGANYADVVDGTSGPTMAQATSCRISPAEPSQDPSTH